MYSADQNCNCLQEAGQTRSCSLLVLDISPTSWQFILQIKIKGRHKPWSAGPDKQIKERSYRFPESPRPLKCLSLAQDSASHSAWSLVHQTSSKPNFWGRKESCFSLVTSTIPNTFPLKGFGEEIHIFFLRDVNPALSWLFSPDLIPHCWNRSSWSEHCIQELKMPMPFKAQPTLLASCRLNFLFRNFQAPLL